MQTTSFGLDSKPFKPKNPRDFYRNDNFDAACADILDGIRERRGFILLTGEAGTGKTFTLRRCMAEADDIRFVLLTNASLDFPEILNHLCTSLRLPIDPLDSEQRRRLLLDEFAAHARRGQAVALLIDDAHSLRIGVLDRLRDFVETPVLASQRLRVVLAGLPEIEGKLRQPELRSLQDGIRVRCRLDRLSEPEIGLFISHQCKIVGRDCGDLLSPAMIGRITHYSKGVPRVIAMLCDAILLFASLEPGRGVTPELVDEAARNCFLGEPSLRATPPAGASAVTAAADIGSDLALPDLDFVIDFSLDKAPEAEQITVIAGLEPAAGYVTPPAPPAPPRAERVAAASAPADGRNGADFLALLEEPTQMPTPPALREFAQLLGDLAAKQERKEARDREALHYFRSRYLRLLQGGDPVRLDECERRITRLAEIRQPVLVSLATAMQPPPERDGMLCALLINPSWWLYREIRLRLRSPDLIFANDGQVAPSRLLDGRDAQPVYLAYRYPRAGPAQTTLWLELDLCDHRGEWRTYNNRVEIRLDFSGRSAARQGATTTAEPLPDYFWPDPPTETAAAGAWLLGDPISARETDGSGGLGCTLPLELEVDPERTYSLQTAHPATGQALSRGTPLTRALLLTTDPAQAPARIELVSRPFMIFGRHSAAAGTGFGDFTLGFVPKYSRISRLHCVLCALGDQLALMPASDRGYTYTGRNGQRLERGVWCLLEADDVLEVCDLYRLKLALAWDRKEEHGRADWDTQEPRDKFGRYLLELVDVLRQRDQRADTDQARALLKDRYLHLLRMQDQMAELNGVGNPGALLYARFEREDAARRQVVHYYVPKWLPLGSSSQAGLRIDAPDVAPRHAELLFREGMYWIQNLAKPGAVRVGCHDLATNEVLALETGDTLMIGAARFRFEAY